MPICIPDRVVVFDYGEVVSRAPSESDRLAILAAAGILVEQSADPVAEKFWSSYWAHRHVLDRGTLSAADYWATIAAEIGFEWRASEVQGLWAADFRSWISVEPATVNLIAELHDGGTRLALLSNAGFDFGSPFRHAPIAQYFEQIFVSAEMDALKPEPSIYLSVADALGITPAQMVFVDNRRVNTEAAAALGVVVHHYTTGSELGAFLGALAA